MAERFRFRSPRPVGRRLEEGGAQEGRSAQEGRRAQEGARRGLGPRRRSVRLRRLSISSTVNTNYAVIFNSSHGDLFKFCVGNMRVWTERVGEVEVWGWPHAKMCGCGRSGGWEY